MAVATCSFQRLLKALLWAVVMLLLLSDGAGEGASPGRSRSSRRDRRSGSHGRSAHRIAVPRYLESGWRRYVFSYSEESYVRRRYSQEQRATLVSSRVAYVQGRLATARPQRPWFSNRMVERLIAYDLAGLPLSAGFLRVWDSEFDRHYSNAEGTTQWNRLCPDGIVPRRSLSSSDPHPQGVPPIPETPSDVPEGARAGVAFGREVRPDVLPSVQWDHIPFPGPVYLHAGWSRYCGSSAEAHAVAQRSDAERQDWFVRRLVSVRDDFLRLHSAEERLAFRQEGINALILWDILDILPSAEALRSLDREYEYAVRLRRGSVDFERACPRGVTPVIPPRRVLESLDRDAFRRRVPCSPNNLPLSVVQSAYLLLESWASPVRGEELRLMRDIATDLRNWLRRLRQAMRSWFSQHEALRRDQEDELMQLGSEGREQEDALQERQRRITEASNRLSLDEAARRNLRYYQQYDRDLLRRDLEARWDQEVQRHRVQHDRLEAEFEGEREDQDREYQSFH